MVSSPESSLSVRVRRYHDQFLLSDTAGLAPSGWQTRTLAGFHIATHPSLPVLALRTTDGLEAGFACGHLIDRDGAYIREDIQLGRTAAAITAQDLEQAIYSFGGRFVCIALLPHLKRFYLDPFGSLAAVWSAKHRRVASTPTVLLHDEPDHPLFRLARPATLEEKPNRFYPAGLTAVAGIHRIVTNHFLDLSAWTTARHHPKAHDAISPDAIPGTVALLHDVMRRHVAAVVGECSGAYIALTAGKDSRRALACAKGVADRIECLTLRADGARFGSKPHLDVFMARQVAAIAGLRHHVFPMSGDEKADRNYLLRIGFSGGPGKSSKFDVPARRHLDLSRGWITGHGGGLCAGVYMRRIPPDARRLGVNHMMKLLRYRNTPEFADAIDAWLSGVPEGPLSFAVDLAILEHQGGSWVAPHMYGTAAFRMNLLTVNHRDMLDALRGLPLEYRTSGTLDRDLLASAWPELGSLPCNEYTGVTRVAVKMRQAAGRLFYAVAGTGNAKSSKT